MGYIYVADNAPCVNKKEGTKSRKKKENDATQCILFYYYDHNMFVHVCTYMCILLSYICIYIVYVGLDIADSVDVSSADDAKCLGTELRL